MSLSTINMLSSHTQKRFRKGKKKKKKGRKESEKEKVVTILKNPSSSSSLSSSWIHNLSQWIVPSSLLPPFWPSSVSQKLIQQRSDSSTSAATQSGRDFCLAPTRHPSLPQALFSRVANPGPSRCPDHGPVGCGVEPFVPKTIPGSFLAPPPIVAPGRWSAMEATPNRRRLWRSSRWTATKVWTFTTWAWLMGTISPCWWWQGVATVVTAAPPGVSSTWTARARRSWGWWLRRRTAAAARVSRVKARVRLSEIRCIAAVRLILRPTHVNHQCTLSSSNMLAHAPIATRMMTRRAPSLVPLQITLSSFVHPLSPAKKCWRCGEKQQSCH